MSGPEQLPGGLQRELQVASMSWGRLLRLGVLAYGQITMLVGDASGKGVAAALMMTSAQASLRTAAQFTGDNLAGFLWTVNAQAWASTPTDRYATLFYGVLNWVTLTLRYVNAGQNAPVLIHRDGSIDWLEPSGAPIGLFPETTWYEEVTHLHPGDLVLAYTDGLTEASSPFGQEWGIDGLLGAAKPRRSWSADKLVRSILDSMDLFFRRRPDRRCYRSGFAGPLRKRTN